jgi:hypothetical protein
VSSIGATFPASLYNSTNRAEPLGSAGTSIRASIGTQDAVSVSTNPTRDRDGNNFSKTTPTDSRQREAQVRQELAGTEAELELLEQAEIREFAVRDREVRTHEQAHMAVGGQYAGGVSYDYSRGPDGRLYAIGGSVSIDTSPVAGDPLATVDKMQQVQRAALAPAEPSGADLAIAAQAAQLIAQARAEIATRNVEGEDAGRLEESSEVDESDPDLYSDSDSDSGTMVAGPTGNKELATYRQIDLSPDTDLMTFRATA